VTLLATGESAPPSPGSVYAVTKLAQESLVASVCPAIGVPWLALRYQNVYGPGQSLDNPYTGVLSVFSRLMIEQRPIEIFEDGEESRDFVFIDDVAAANVAAFEADAGVEGTINVGTGVATSINTVVDLLAKHLGYSGQVTISGRFRSGDIRHNLADVTRLERLLRMKCDTPFADGIARFCAWAGERLRSESSTDSQSAYRRSLAELESRGLIN
jgi:dTDP-L-rhamnose 4-epimerase